MGVVLAIDPGRRQGKTVDRLAQEFREHEVIVATSGDEALAVMEGLIPDLVVFPLFIAPSDESRLQGRLQALADPSDRQALTIPLRAFFDWEVQATRPAAVPPRWFYWFKPRTSRDESLASPRAFADAVRVDVIRPRLEQSLQSHVPLPTSVPAFEASPEVGPALTAALAAPPIDPSAYPSSDSVAFAPPVVSAPAVSASASAGTAWPDRPVEIASPDAPAYPSAPRVGSIFGVLDESVADVMSDEGESPSRDRLSAIGTVASATGRGLIGAGRLLGRLAPAAVSAWRAAQRLPSPIKIALPVVAILLTLGMTGQVALVFSSTGRWMTAARNRWLPEKPKTGTAEIQTVPDGAEVWYQGRQLGVTPLRTEFAVGSHEVELRYRNTTRTVQLDVAAGGTIVQRIEWAAPRVTGRLRVESDPPGATVLIDGKPRGVTPLHADDVTAGRHTVDVTMNGNTVHEIVDVKGGKTVSLRTSIYQGWLALFSPIELSLSLDGRPLTLDDQNRTMLPSGTHRLTLQNRALGYTDTQSVEIRPGDTTPLSVALPRTTMTVTTSAPAEVWIDGERAGEAPVTDWPVDIGTRSVTARSPEHGERQATVTATVNPISVAIDFAVPAP
ncbi:MAG: PEGA domain-containing protein [Vicinamibacterales bacterium]